MNRKTIIQEAIDKCLEEMYQKSQPKGSYYDYVDKVKKGEISKNELVFERHYLCEAQFNYILKKYIKAYRFQNEWESNIDFIEKCFKEGGYKTVYKPLIDGDDPCRQAEKMEPLKNLIGEENANKVFEYIKNLKTFYHFDREESIFNFNIALGASPTSNAERVKNYWKSQGIDIEIDETELTEDQYWEIDEYGHILEENE